MQSDTGESETPVRLGLERMNHPRFLARFTHFGIARYCPCCRAFLRRFGPFGVVPRPAECPVCGSLERDRLTWLYMRHKTNLLDGRPKKLLHIAPEAQLSRLFQKIDRLDYLSADLQDPLATEKLDLCDIPHADNAFDIIYCSHVLEHIPDDRQALRELCRVLKPGGWAIFLVPMSDQPTFEDPSVTSPEERERLFGQNDHVRQYGPDFKDRLAEAGFSVTVDPFVRGLDDKQVWRWGLLRNEDVYLCEKPGPGPVNIATTRTG